MEHEPHFDDAQPKTVPVDLDNYERNTSMISGAFLLLLALTRRDWLGVGCSALGASLMYQAGTGISIVRRLQGKQHPKENMSMPQEGPVESKYWGIWT